MNWSVSKKNCKFYIDKEHGKVVCVIPNTKNAAREFLEDQYITLTQSINWESTSKDNSIQQVLRALQMPNSFSGIATCHPEDTFDEEIGKLIAYNKARRKLNVSLFKRLNLYVRRLDAEFNNLINDCNAYGKKQDEREAIRKKKIEECLNDNSKRTD